MADVDLYLVAGQSNAEGRGTSGPSVPTGVGYEVVGSTVSHLADPVGGANTGSAWPAFANELHLRTGRAVAITEAASSAAALLADANPSSNFSSTGTLANAAVTAATDALAALATAGHTPTLRGILWHQGEREAQNLSAATIATDYEAALSDLLDRLQAGIGQSVPMYVARVGDAGDGTNAAAWQAVRDAQDAAATNDPDIIMAFTGCVDFPGLGWMSDNVHYSQAGYDQMGTEMAAAIGPSVESPMLSAVGAILSQQSATPSIDILADVAWQNAWWADGDEFAALGLANGAAVSSWPDEVSTADAAQATGANQPTYAAAHASLNNKPALTFDGANDSIAADIADITGVCTIVMVGCMNAVPGAGGVQWLFDGITSTARRAIAATDTLWRLYQGGTVHTGGTVDTNPHLFVATYDTTDTLDIDGTATASGDAGSHNLTGLRIGSRYDGTNNWAAMSAAFVGIKAGALTVDELATVEAWAAAEYGVTIA